MFFKVKFQVFLNKNLPFQLYSKLKILPFQPVCGATDTPVLETSALCFITRVDPLLAVI